MIKASEANVLTMGYFEKGNAESKTWLDNQLIVVDAAIRNASTKGQTHCEVEIEFEPTDPWQLARTKLISDYLHKEMCYSVLVSERSKPVNDVLKKPITHLTISW